MLEIFEGAPEFTDLMVVDDWVACPKVRVQDAPLPAAGTPAPGCTYPLPEFPPARYSVK